MSVSSAGQGLRPGVVTSTTRPSSPYTGMTIYEVDTGYLRVWDGSAWDYLSKSQDGTTNLPIENIGKGAASIYRTSALAIGNASDIVVTWSSSEFDNNSMWSASATDRLTINTAGVYVVTATIAWASNGTGERISWIQKNGNSGDRWGMVRGGAWSTGETMYNLATIMSLVATDYIQVGVYQASGGNLNLNGSGTARTRFSATRIAP